MKILVVDDDPVVGTIVNDFLTAHGHNIEVIDSGEKALAKLNGTTESPDMVILDFVMPDMNGIDVLQKIKGTNKTESLPVVMLSANDDTGDILEGYEFQADHYLEKPFSIRKILDIIKILEAEKSLK